MHAKSRADDEALVRRAQGGDRAAFDALVRKYHDKVVTLVMRYMRDPAEAEDVAQDAFIKAYRALPQFRGDSAFYTWLHRIAINTAKRAAVRAGRHPALPLHNDDGEEINYDDPATTSPQERELEKTSAADRYELIKRERLSERSRAAWQLVVEEGLTATEAAARLGRTEAAVAMCVSRARRELADDELRERLRPDKPGQYGRKETRALQVDGSAPSKAPPIQRFLRMRDAPRYLGLNKNRFNALVRPFVREIPLGKRAIAFDRIDLDRWADEYSACNGRPPINQRLEGGPSWERSERPASMRGTGFGISTSASNGTDAFARALDRAMKRKPGGISRGVLRKFAKPRSTGSGLGESFETPQRST